MTRLRTVRTSWRSVKILFLQCKSNESCAEISFNAKTARSIPLSQAKLAIFVTTRIMLKVRLNIMLPLNSRELPGPQVRYCIPFNHAYLTKIENYLWENNEKNNMFIRVDTPMITSCLRRWYLTWSQKVTINHCLLYKLAFSN